ncbi:hypothetical protein [Adlercreutzia sp. ZJ242]|uniref:hypothetical protein n=1 Tax=Adlercreutzia sp. ZJ242 TaxID=2709409 RepID=UPI00198107A7|nr:hypothetical protein [Adlercreutzia sp. ZJ242]
MGCFLGRSLGRIGFLVAGRSFGAYAMRPVLLNLLYKALGWGSAVALSFALFKLGTFAIALGGSLLATTAPKKAPGTRSVL